MNTQRLTLTAGIICFLLGFFLTHDKSTEPVRSEPESEGPSALKSFEWWYAQRAYPYDMIPVGSYERAARSYRALVKSAPRTVSSVSPWHSIGPVNIGGRTLAIAVNPAHHLTVWAGAASGGLWKSVSGGDGVGAWSYVNTGFNTVSVSAIAIDPVHPDTMYIGTGEISLYHRPLVGTPGARSSYGMGILKSADGGVSWTQTGLTFQFPQITAVQRIVINPENTSTLFAATSEGVYRSGDGGSTWAATDTVPMAMDVAICPGDTSIIIAAHGNANSSPNPGMYRSSDGGTSWQKLASGLPSSNFGRTTICFSQSQPSVVYAGIASGLNDKAFGIYKSTDTGSAWVLATSTDYISAQGWYNNVLAVNPVNPDSLIAGGVYMSISADGAANLNSIAAGWFHVDQHAVTYDPTNRRIIYIGNDGGLWKTTDGGATFLNLNNSYITTQFYPGFANAVNDSTIALGGLQDNGTLLYNGTPYWSQVYINDGGWCAINPVNPLIQYCEYQYMSIARSTNGGLGFVYAGSGLPATGPGGGESFWNFIPPFELAPSSQYVLYAGGLNVYKTTNGGASWYAPNGGSYLNGTKVACIGISATSPDTLMTATGSGALSDVNPLFQVFASINGGQTWTNVTGSLPNRYPTSIVFDPADSRAAYITFSGYGTPHCFHTTDLGQSWVNISGNLPDIPHQTIVADPEVPASLYAGTDLGVFHSSDRGGSWEPLTDGMPPAMILDLTISPANKALRAATFGNGIYERPLLREPEALLTAPSDGAVLVGGTPVSITWQSRFVTRLIVEISLDGGLTWNTFRDTVNASDGSVVWNASDTATSLGLIRLRDAGSGSLLDVMHSAFTILVHPDLLPGWNMISLSYRVGDPRVTSLYPDAVSRAFAYVRRYEESDTLHVGSGYWIKVPAPRYFSITGDTILADTTQLQAGWNMIGGPGHAVDILSIVQVPANNLISHYFGYRSGYAPVDTLYPGFGYWIKALAPGTLILGNPGSVQAGSKVPGTEERERFDVLTFTGASGASQSLYAGTQSGSTGTAGFEMPPPPPEGLFDVRFASGSMAAFLVPGDPERGRIRIAVHAPEGGTSCTYNGIDGRYVLTGDDGSIMALRGGVTFRVPAGGLWLTAVPQERTGIPRAVELYQNYPNPFNGSTSVRYSLPERQDVSITIYDLTGREVSTIVRGAQDRGEHTAVWDATRFASGVYYCRLSAGSLNKTITILHIR